MDIGTNLTPMRWPKGPYWTQPAALDLIQGTPLDCLILPWASDTQAGQFQALFAAGKERGIAFVGLLGDGVNPSDAIPSARTAGLSALATAKPESLKGFPAIPWVSRSQVSGLPAGPVAAFTDNFWPSVKTTKMFLPGRCRRRSYRSPVDRYQRLVCANGAHAAAGTVGLDLRGSSGEAGDLAARRIHPGGFGCGIERRPLGGFAGRRFCRGARLGDARSLAAWKNVTAALAFFDSHRDWQTYRSLGLVGVVSNFSGDNEFFSGEALNLIGRRQLPYRILVKSKMPANALGLKRWSMPMRTSPRPGFARRCSVLRARVRLLVCLKKFAALAGRGHCLKQGDPQFDVFQLGSGRVAVSTEDAADPYLLANKTHMLLSRKNDLFARIAPELIPRSIPEPGTGTKRSSNSNFFFGRHPERVR